MVRLVTEESKTTPVLSVITIDTSAEFQYITNTPTDAYTGILDLYSVDGRIYNTLFSSALIMSNDTTFDQTGLEDNFSIIYSVDGVDIRYVYLTSVIVNHNQGTTAILIPGYQTNIYYTFDGTNSETAPANLTSYNGTSFYSIGCARLCLLGSMTASVIFKPREPKFSYYDTSNTSIYTDAEIGGNVGQDLVFDVSAFGFGSNVVAYVKDDNTVEIGGEVHLTGLGDSVDNLEEWMIVA